MVGGANANLVRDSLANLDWLVAVNLWDLETPNFWNRPGTNPADISTEVFLLPCAASFEKEGSVTNSGRWAQWRWKAVEPLGDSMPDAWITNELMKRVRALYEAEGGPNADAITKLYWDYGDGEVDTHFVAKEINGWFTDDVYDDDGNLVGRKGDLVPSFGVLRADGTTCSANWLYSGSYTESGQPDGPPRQQGLPPGRHWPLQQVVLVLARQPAHHLQPRFLRQQRPALRSGSLRGLVEGRRASGIRRMGRTCPTAAGRPTPSTPLS